MSAPLSLSGRLLCRANTALATTPQLRAGLNSRAASEDAILLGEHRPVNTVRPVAEKPHLTPRSRNDAEWRAIRERRRLSHDPISSDRRNRVPSERSEEKIIARARSNDRWRVRRRENRDLDGRRHSCDRRSKSAGNPNIAVRPGGNRGRGIYAGKFRNLTARSDPSELADRLFCEPDIPVISEGHVARKRIRCRSFELGEKSAREIITPDGVVRLIAKPDIAIGASGDAHAHAKEGELTLGDLPGGSDKRDPACRSFAEPDIAIGAKGHERRIAQARRAEGSDLAARSDLRHLGAV